MNCPGFAQISRDARPSIESKLKIDGEKWQNPEKDSLWYILDYSNKDLSLPSDLFIGCKS